jgi:hypothetical protein
MGVLGSGLMPLSVKPTVFCELPGALLKPADELPGELFELADVLWYTT